MIQIEQVEFKYPGSGFRLHVPELTIEPGERVAFVGASGCGKTTLMNLVAGILVPQRGTVNVGDVAVHELTDAGRRTFRVTQLGFVFQDFGLVDYLDATENVLLPCYINDSLELSGDVRERAAALLGEVGLGDRRRCMVDELSYGENQRVAIARAMLNRPRYLLADEPTGNLDPENTRHILDLLLHQSAGATLLMVTHDTHILDAFDRVVDVGGWL